MKCEHMDVCDVNITKTEFENICMKNGNCLSTLKQRGRYAREWLQRMEGET